MPGDDILSINSTWSERLETTGKLQPMHHIWSATSQQTSKLEVASCSKNNDGDGLRLCFKFSSVDSDIYYQYVYYENWLLNWKDWLLIGWC